MDSYLGEILGSFALVLLALVILVRQEVTHELEDTTLVQRGEGRE